MNNQPVSEDRPPAILSSNPDLRTPWATALLAREVPLEPMMEMSGLASRRSSMTGLSSKPRTHWMYNRCRRCDNLTMAPNVGPESTEDTARLGAYNGAQHAAREERDMPDRNQKKSVRKDGNKSPVLQDDSSSSGDERDVIPEDQRRHQPSSRPRPRSPPPKTDSSSSDEEEQQRHASRQRKKTRV